MRTLMERAEALARGAQRRQLDQLANAWRERGVGVTTSGSDVIVEARGLRRRRLTDPLLRFAGLGW